LKLTPAKGKWKDGKLEGWQIQLKPIWEGQGAEGGALAGKKDFEELKSLLEQIAEKIQGNQ